MLASLATVVWLDQTRTARRHGEALQLTRDVIVESNQLLDQLAQQRGLNCDDKGLFNLNAMLLRSRYVREIGLLDDKGRLFCTTALGRMPEPFKGTAPIHVSRSGMTLRISALLIMSGDKVRATIIERPFANVVISPYATEDLYASADAVWMLTRGGLHLLAAKHADVNGIPAMRRHVERLAGSNFAWQGLGYELVSMAPDLDVALQTRRDLLSIVRHDALLPVLLAVSVLIALLFACSLRPFIYKLSSLRNRIEFLCKEAHLLLVYQPVYDLATMRPVGCEVLARIKEGDTLWTPDRMIPAVQAAGLEHRLDHAVTCKAIRELAAHLPAWEGKFSIALNFFPRSIVPDVLVPIFSDALDAAGRDDLAIIIEITEYSLSSELIPEVQHLKTRGFLVAVDDFGTGYSNLKSVTRLSPDLLKIDRSFVHDLEDDTVRSSVIPEIVHIARAVDADTIAEGIEKPEQVQLLLAAGVRYGQGYALARPLTIEGFIALVESQG